MGAWGTGTFENDDALDFVGTLVEADDLTMVEEMLRAVLGDHEDGYLDAGFAAPGLVAAEVIAARRGHSGQLPPELAAWVAQVGPASDDTAQLAQRAVQRILADNSELRELWEESDEFSAWQAEIDGLLKRLAIA